MAIIHRAATQSISIDQLPPEDPNYNPVIYAPGQTGVPTAFVTDGPNPSVTQSSSQTSTPSSTSASSRSSAAATSTQTATASKAVGLSRGNIAAIVVPIGVLAILVPILVLWYLDRKHKLAAAKRFSQRSSNEVMLQKRSSIQKPPQPKGPKPVRPKRTPRASAVNPQSPDRRNSLGLFNFELSPPSTPGMGWMTPNPRFSIARALQMRRSQPSIVQSQPRTSRGESDRPQTGNSERSARRQTGTSIFDPPPPYINDAASPKPAPQFAPLERIGTLHQTDRSQGPTMQPTMAPTLPPIAATEGALDVQQPLYTPRHTPRVSSEILQLPDVYGRVHTRSPSPTLSIHNGSNLTRPFSYTAPERISDVSGLSDEPEPWRRLRESNGSSVISPIDSDESSTIHPHHLL